MFRRGDTYWRMLYRKHELDKYEERVREIEHGSFSPLVFSTAGGMGPIATTVYKRIASLIADKRQEPYSTTLFWLRCKLSFSLLRSAIMCLRGTRSFHSHSQHHSIALACAEAKVHWTIFQLALFIYFVSLFCILCVLLLLQLKIFIKKKDKHTSLVTMDFCTSKITINSCKKN